MANLTVTRRLLEEVTIECPQENQEEAFALIDKENLRCIRSGPKPISFGRVDPEIYQFVGTRDVTESSPQG